MLKRLLRRLVTKGELAIALPSGEWIAIGVARHEDAAVALRIHDWRALAHIVRDPALAVGEAYMDGTLTIERGDIYDFLTLATRNLAGVSRRRRRAGANGHRRAKCNVAHHYDLSGELYRLLLDADRQYSCAYFARPGISLEAAQAAKKRHIAAKLLLGPGQRVLDIGSGWGGMALTLAGEYGVDALGITLSQEQLGEARKRAVAQGLEQHARFELKDYRDVCGRFDRIVSVGMFEHVGPKDYDTFFSTIERCLAEEGVALVHTIGTCAGPEDNNPWIEKYIFPGGVIPALSQIAPAIGRSGLILTDIEVLRLHYADTLRVWRERFAANRNRARALYDERFCRMWEFYLAGAEAGFRDGSLVVFQLQLAKHRAAAPLTRDYITDFDRASEGLAIAAE
jgi:cyclopropane-fatty-acyl-phospholipid synthase